MIAAVPCLRAPAWVQWHDIGVNRVEMFSDLCNTCTTFARRSAFDTRRIAVADLFRRRCAQRGRVSTRAKAR